MNLNIANTFMNQEFPVEMQLSNPLDEIALEVAQCTT
jgi:hypothetical protein